jgi:hypothetical protein
MMECFLVATLPRNVTIVTVANIESLQRQQCPACMAAFRQFLDWGRFGHVFFMQPHRDCFFDFARNKSLPHCIDLSSLDDTDDLAAVGGSAGRSGGAQRSSGLWGMLDERRARGVLQLQQVMAWQPSALQQGHVNRLIGGPVQLPTIDSNEFIHPRPCMRIGSDAPPPSCAADQKRPCPIPRLIDACRPKPLGHQCLPGAITLASRRMVADAWRGLNLSMA